MTLEVPIDPPADIYGIFYRLNYEYWTALAEFVDNSLQSFQVNREALAESPFRKKFVTVRIAFQAKSRRIVVMDDAGGIQPTEFSRAFRVAVPPVDATGLNEFGMGMKCAAFWFTRQWSVSTRHIGDTVRRNIVIDLAKIRDQKLKSLEVEEVDSVITDHGTSITLSNVGDARMPNAKNIAKVRDFLTDIYRVAIRNGSLRLEVDGVSCKVEESDVLSVPVYNSKHEPIGPEVEWRKEICIDLPGDRRVSGFAAIFSKGKRADAGFALFRRGRVVSGFHQKRWMPEVIFGKKNSYESLRVFGELHFENFGVGFQKDQLDWDGFEDDFIDELKKALNAEPMRILAQARNYRSHPALEGSPDGIAVEIDDAVTGTADALTQLGPTLERRPIGPGDNSELVAINPAPREVIGTKRKFPIRFDGADWVVEFQFLRRLEGRPEVWLDVIGAGNEVEDGDGVNLLQIRINLDHPFSRNHITMESAQLEPILRIAAALALAERLAKLAGVQTPSVIRSRMNQVLSQALGHSGADE